MASQADDKEILPSLNLLVGRTALFLLCTRARRVGRLAVNLAKAPRLSGKKGMTRYWWKLCSKNGKAVNLTLDSSQYLGLPKRKPLRTVKM